MLRQKLMTVKSALEAKGLKAKVMKTKVMFRGKYKVAVGHVSCAQLMIIWYISDVMASKDVWKRFRILSAVYVRLALVNKII